MQCSDIVINSNRAWKLIRLLFVTIQQSASGLCLGDGPVAMWLISKLSHCIKINRDPESQLIIAADSFPLLVCNIYLSFWIRQPWLTGQNIFAERAKPSVQNKVAVSMEP